jgi:glutaredoxin
MSVKVSVYYTPECPADEFLKELRETLTEAGISYEIEEIVLVSDDEAVEHKVLGVPTVRINGADVDPNFEDKGIYRAACTRLYKWKGNVYSFPPKEMILEALRRLGVRK